MHTSRAVVMDAVIVQRQRTATTRAPPTRGSTPHNHRTLLLKSPSCGVRRRGDGDASPSFEGACLLCGGGTVDVAVTTVRLTLHPGSCGHACLLHRYLCCQEEEEKHPLSTRRRVVVLEQQKRRHKTSVVACDIRIAESLLTRVEFAGDFALCTVGVKHRRRYDDISSHHISLRHVIVIRFFFLSGVGAH